MSQEKQPSRAELQMISGKPIQNQAVMHLPKFTENGWLKSLLLLNYWYF
jgi:hypothetical protein